MNKKKRYKSTATFGRLGKAFIRVRVNPGGKSMVRTCRNCEWSREEEYNYQTDEEGACLVCHLNPKPYVVWGDNWCSNWSSMRDVKI